MLPHVRQHLGGIFLRSDGTHSKTTVLLSDYPAPDPACQQANRVRGFFCVYRILFRVCRLVVPSASPRPPRSQPARSACEACMLCMFNDPAYIARCWISSESCQQTLSSSRCLPTVHHWVADRGPHDTRTSAATCQSVCCSIPVDYGSVLVCPTSFP